MSDLTELRQRIDALDGELLKLLNERTRIAREIGVIKNRESLPIYSPDREMKLLRSLVDRSEGPLPPEAIRAIYREIMSAALSVEKDVAIACVGPVGSSSYQAALGKFGSSVRYTFSPEIAGVFEEVAADRADCGVVPEPTVAQLASIGVQTGLLARQVFGHTPRIAFLSFSTHGSAAHPSAMKMAAAAALARDLALSIGGSDALDHPMEIDGELQGDTALAPAVASIKLPESMVAGRANVLVFPDLNSGNIAAKLTQYLAGAHVYGQIVTGLSRPAAEVSRGSHSEDIAAIAAIIGLQAVEYRTLYPLSDDPVILQK